MSNIPVFVNFCNLPLSGHKLSSKPVPALGWPGTPPAAGSTAARLAGGGGVSREQLEAVPDILERFPVENVLWAFTPNGRQAALILQERLSRSETPVIPPQTGQVLDLGSGVALRVLSVGERGAVLLPLGIDFDLLETLQKDPRLVQIEALLLADGGLAALNLPEWIGKLRPQVLMLSAGQSQPDPETLQAVESYTLLRTDRNGWIQLSTDGERMWVEVERR